jgi:hypothetical protein
MKFKIALSLIGVGNILMAVVLMIGGDHGGGEQTIQTAVLFFIWAEVWA